jgi:hypothetical protein
MAEMGTHEVMCEGDGAEWVGGGQYIHVWAAGLVDPSDDFFPRVIPIQPIP